MFPIEYSYQNFSNAEGDIEDQGYLIDQLAEAEKEHAIRAKETKEAYEEYQNNPTRESQDTYLASLERSNQTYYLIEDYRNRIAQEVKSEGLYVPEKKKTTIPILAFFVLAIGLIALIKARK
uniref:Uncharacterized protein n=1 Tax=viral metagenome TaxID=1070528 RepID=A0A6M3KHF8_9ZZZZ